MPVYDFACSDPHCAERFEARVPIADADKPLTCASCGKPVHRAFNPKPVPVYYHGMGWAKKDRYWEKVDASEQ